MFTISSLQNYIITSEFYLVPSARVTRELSPITDYNHGLMMIYYFRIFDTFSQRVTPLSF